MNTASSGPSDAIIWDTLELAPDLPLSVFTSMERWHGERIGALALYCSDGRWGEAFDEFCHKHLQIPRYDRWAVPGGPAWLAAPDDREDFYQTAREQLDFLVRVHELQQIVLITHFGCAYYSHRLQKGARECLPAQAEDVRIAKATLRRWYPDIRVENYLAMRGGHLVSFHRLDD
ncbi:MAG TPA: carbonic anhydrase [Gemmataceae bacterium]|nr:carbonic anhydrase [Gemmataceae bacterium]